jgi:hypothetical protein
MLKDKLVTDSNASMTLACAGCGQFVKTGEDHQCGANRVTSEEKQNGKETE